MTKATRWMRMIPACFTLLLLLLEMLQPALCQSYALSLSPVYPVVEYRYRAMPKRIVCLALTFPRLAGYSGNL